MKKRQILLIYIVLGIFWIFVTDFFVENYIPTGMLMTVQKVKGILYVIITGVFIHFYLKKLEELNKSQEQEEKLTTLINAMPDFVNFKDGEGRWIEANNFGLKLFKLEGVDFRGKKDSELAEHSSFYRDSLLSCEASDEKAWDKGRISSSEEVVPVPDGSKKYFETIKVPIFNEDGSRKGLVVIGRDITTRKLAEEHIRKTEKLSIVGELAASVGHEIRNPLTSIKGFVQLLSEKDATNEMYYSIMSKELDRIDHIVGELLILAKPQKIIFGTYDLKEIIADIVSLLETQANMNHIKIHFDTEEEYWIECEENQLKQLFINIIKNAIEASTENGNVWITIEKLVSEENFLVSVIDEGTGISDDFQKRLGEPFYSSKEKGTGLGLTVSYKIVQQHAGKIEISSREGVGTKVEIILPVKNEKRVS